MLNDGDMEGVEDLPGGIIPQSVRLRIRRVSDQDAWAGSLVDLRVVGLDQRKGTASDFTQVG